MQFSSLEWSCVILLTIAHARESFRLCARGSPYNSTLKLASIFLPTPTYDLIDKRRIFSLPFSRDWDYCDALVVKTFLLFIVFRPFLWIFTLIKLTYSGHVWPDFPPSLSRKSIFWDKKEFFNSSFNFCSVSKFNNFFPRRLSLFLFSTARGESYWIPYWLSRHKEFFFSALFYSN